jgi:CubicO group peptidase (beta-lactamase class C family)
MSELRDLLDRHVESGWAPGAVGLLAHRDSVEVQAVGSIDLEASAPMARDTIFRIASITKPIMAAAVLMLVEDGRLALEDPIGAWLPELAAPMVVRTPGSSVDDVVPAQRPITIEDLLSSRTGYGFSSDFSLPAVQKLLTMQPDGREIQLPPPPDEWLATLSAIPLAYQPGAAYLYNTSSDLQGVLVARVSGQALPDLLAERVFAPLAMVDTSFVIPATKLDRFCASYRVSEDGTLVLHDAPSGRWSEPPAFPSGAGGLLSTVDDWCAFGRMLLAGGTLGGKRVLSAESVRLLTTNHLTSEQRQIGQLFLEGQGWGYGGSVDLEHLDPWNVPGRYGWVGGTGTSAHITPATGTVAVLLTQRGMTDPTPPAIMREFWTLAALGA